MTMIKRRWMTCLLTMLLCASGPLVRAETPDEMIAAAKELDAKFLASFKKGDVDAAMALYWKSPETVSYPVMGPALKGWDAIKANMIETFKSPLEGKMDTSGLTYTVHGDSIVVHGTWKIVGGPEPMEGFLTEVVAKRDGKWVFILDHVSLVQSPPAASGK